MKGTDKLQEFRRSIGSLLGIYDIIIITETWLDDTISDAELGLSGYQIFRRDRSGATSSKDRGGGVIIAIREGLDATPIISEQSLELQYVLLRDGSSSLLISAIYLPPDAPIDSYNCFTDTLVKTHEQFPSAKLILLGDYNLPHVSWVFNALGSSFSTDDSTSPLTKENASIIARATGSLNLFQQNDIKNHTGSLLDLVFVSDINTTVELALDSVLPVDPYHPPLVITTNLIQGNDHARYKTVTYQDFKNGNYEMICHELNEINWDDVFVDLNAHATAEIFYNTLYYVIQKHVPVKTFVCDNTFPVWANQLYKSLVIQKKIAH